jgi:hypothetical protein
VSNRLIFVSCGQLTTEEKSLGLAVKSAIDTTLGFEAYFAESVHDLEALGRNVFDALRRCSGAVVFLHNGVSANLLYGCEQLNLQHDCRRAGIWLCGSAAHLVRLEEERWRDGQAEGLGRLQVDDPLEPHDLLHRQGARFRTLSQVIPEGRYPAVPLRQARAVRHEPSKLCPCPVQG